MTETTENNEKEFVPTKNISLQQIKEILGKYKGKAIILNGLPDDTHWTLKIRDEPFVREYENEAAEGGVKTVAYFPVEYKYKKDVRIPLVIRTSKNCYDKFWKNNEGVDVKGRYAIFSKKKWQGKNVQSIGLCPTDFEPKSFEDFPDPLKMMEEADSGSAPEESKPDDEQESEFDYGEFVANFMKQIATLNEARDKQGKPEDIVTPTADLAALRFFRTYYPEQYRKIKEQF